MPTARTRPGPTLTKPRKFARETGVDAMAISVGNVHLQQDKEGGLDLRPASKRNRGRSQAMYHWSSTVALACPVAQRTLPWHTASKVCKFNIGTELRMAFGQAMREAVNSDASRFDRVSILKDTHDPMVQAARTVLSAMGHEQKGI